MLLGVGQGPLTAPPSDRPTPGTAFCNLNLIDFHEGPHGDWIHTPSGLPCDPNFIGEVEEYVITAERPPSPTIKKFLIFGGIVGAVGLLSWLWFSPRANPRRRRRRRYRRNPDPVEQYEGFHWGKEPDAIKRVRTSKRPKKLVQLGELQAVIYRSDKNDGKHDYIHDFSGEKPVLAMDSDNRRLHFVGGSYDVEDRGIVG